METIMHNLYVSVREGRAALIHQVATTARSAATSPDLVMDATARRALGALAESLAHYEHLVRVLAQPGHEKYAERDLPQEEKDDLAAARHFLKILALLHGVEPLATYDPDRNLTPAGTPLTNDEALRQAAARLADAH